jgi:hypothetical protein
MLFSGFHKNILKSGLQPLALFKKVFSKNLGIVPTNKKKEIKIQQRMVHVLPIFKRFSKIQKFLVLSRKELKIQYNIR